MKGVKSQRAGSRLETMQEGGWEESSKQDKKARGGRRLALVGAGLLNGSK